MYRLPLHQPEPLLLPRLRLPAGFSLRTVYGRRLPKIWPAWRKSSIGMPGEGFSFCALPLVLFPLSLIRRTAAPRRKNLRETRTKLVYLFAMMGCAFPCIQVFRYLDPTIQNWLAVENDERLYNLDDCLWVSEVLGIPVVLDISHQRLNPDNHSLLEAVSETWAETDGISIVDYSSTRWIECLER